MTPTSRLYELLTERFTAPALRLLVTFDDSLAAARLGSSVNFDQSVQQVALDLVEAAGHHNLLAALAASVARARPLVPEATEVARLFAAAGSEAPGTASVQPGAVPPALGERDRLTSAPDTGHSVPHSFRLSGKARLELQDGLVARWESLAVYFDATPADRHTFERASSPPGKLLDWLQERKKLHALRDAFSALGWDDLIEVLDRHPC